MISKIQDSSSLLRLSKIICWSPLNLSPILRLAPLVPFTFCVRFQESLTCGFPLGVFLSTDHFVLISVSIRCQLGGFWYPLDFFTHVLLCCLHGRILLPRPAPAYRVVDLGFHKLYLIIVLLRPLFSWPRWLFSRPLAKTLLA